MKSINLIQMVAKRFYILKNKSGEIVHYISMLLKSCSNLYSYGKSVTVSFTGVAAESVKEITIHHDFAFKGWGH